MAYSWDRGFHAARIDKRLRELLQTGDRRVSFKEMQVIQADVILGDAEVLRPFIVRAFDRAASDSSAAAPLRALASDAGIAEAIGRLRLWNGATPTGIELGYDASDTRGKLAMAADCDEETILACLLHDVGLAVNYPAASGGAFKT